MKNHQVLTRFVLLAGLFLLALSFVSPAQAREIWLNPVEAGKNRVGNWGGVKFKKEVHFQWRVPDDFDDTTGSATLLVIGLKDQDLNFQVNVNVAIDGDLNDVNPTNTGPLPPVALTAGTLTEIPLTGALPILARGDYVAMNIERVGKKKVKALIVGMRFDYSTAFVDLAAFQALFAGVTRNGNTLLFEGMNLQIVNGLGETDGVPDGELTILGEVNGLGNLIIGYNEARDDGVDSDKSGSHNLVVGSQHNYSSYGSLVAGLKNTTSGIFSTVSSGYGNTASGIISSVTGGEDHEASGDGSSVSGGQGNTASGEFSSVSGGFANTASANNSSVSGGGGNTASGIMSSVSGGGGNTASRDTSSVSGGSENTASGPASSVSGGFGNTASGSHASVSGGRLRSAPNENNWAAGGLSEPN
jgi:hypothetical protein